MYTRVFKSAPAVFAVGNTYQIMVPVKSETLMWVKVGERSFYDHANGTMRSADPIHRMTVPMSLLDTERKYRVYYRIVTERKPYFTETEDEQFVEFEFKPVPSGNSKAYLIADAHNDANATVKAAKEFEKKYGEIDFLMLGGDIPNDSGTIENFDTIYTIADKVTGGRKPILYAKGNHDMRGICAEKMDLFSPTQNGNTYFTFHIGDIWGMILDCGEDKNDGDFEYGNTICCHEFRLEETDYIKQVIDNSASEYEKDGIRHKMIFVHIPFSRLDKPPFIIEQELYREWCTLLRENVKPDIMVCGHLHSLEVLDVGCEQDNLGQPCKVLIGSKPYKTEDGARHFAGTGLFFTPDGIKTVFNDDEGNFYL